MVGRVLATNGPKKFHRNQNLRMKNYSLLFVRSNQLSIQGRYVTFTMIVLRKSLRLHINCLVNVFLRSLIVVLMKAKSIVMFYLDE